MSTNTNQKSDRSNRRNISEIMRKVRSSDTMPEVEINNFRGALSTTAKGVFITTSHFTRAAVLESNHTSKLAITLIDGIGLGYLVARSKLDLTTAPGG